MPITNDKEILERYAAAEKVAFAKLLPKAQLIRSVCWALIALNIAFALGAFLYFDIAWAGLLLLNVVGLFFLLVSSRAPVPAATSGSAGTLA